MNQARKFPAVVVLAAVSLWPACSRTETSHHHEIALDSVEAAEKAYFQFDLDRASAIYERIWTDEGASDKDRAEAGRQLARFAALFDQDIERARQLLDEARLIEGEAVPALLMLAKIEREADNYERARTAANLAVNNAETLTERYDADTEFAWAALSKVVDASFSGELGGDTDNPDRELLSEALARLDSVLDERRGQLAPSLVQLELALLLGDGTKVFEAWNSYFHIRPGTRPSGMLSEPAKTLERLLPNCNGAYLDDADLMLALAGSRMFEAAALVATRLPGGPDSDPRLSQVVAYNDYLRAIDQTTIAYYRAASAGDGNQGGYREALEQEGRRLWPRLHWPSERPAFSDARFLAEIGARFGAERDFKTANGHFGLHMGHRVIDEDYPVEQYGKKASLNFISLDFMVSNGYSSWFWDGRANVGGWADNPVITQVRQAYADGGIRAWEEITDPKKRIENEEEIAENGPKDLELARNNPHAYLPGLARRLDYTAGKKLLTELEVDGLDGAELRLAFIAEIERINFESSIIAHEGRHAIETRHPLNFTRRPAEKEFRAKLSEVAFSSAPFLAVTGGILSRNIGDGTSHGEANERIVKGVVKWMKKHQAEIGNLDSSLPLLPQLDRLTDEQLREAFRSLDPMAP